MIILGYQGIGKTTLCREKHCFLDLEDNNYFVDLESSNFFVDGKRSSDWHIIYCNIAKALSDQGFRVFTSAHEPVCNNLMDYNGAKLLIYPAMHLKDEWINRLQKRYEESGHDKDYRAFLSAKIYYTEQIEKFTRIIHGKFTHIVIKDIEYSLHNLIEHYVDSDIRC